MMPVTIRIFDSMMELWRKRLIGPAFRWELFMHHLLVQCCNFFSGPAQSPMQVPSGYGLPHQNYMVPSGHYSQGPGKMTSLPLDSQCDSYYSRPYTVPTQNSGTPSSANQPGTAVYAKLETPCMCLLSGLFIVGRVLFLERGSLYVDQAVLELTEIRDRKSTRLNSSH